MDIRRVLGENVKYYRVAAGLSQEELAARMGVDQGYVSSLEIGKRNPTVVTLWHAAIALNVAPAMLLDSRVAGTKQKAKRVKGPKRG